MNAELGWVRVRAGREDTFATNVKQIGADRFMVCFSSQSRGCLFLALNVQTAHPARCCSLDIAFVHTFCSETPLLLVGNFHPLPRPHHAEWCN